MSIITSSINPYPDDPIFGKLWKSFHDIHVCLAGYEYEWQAYGTDDTNHKVFVIHNGETKAIGFAHELAKLSTSQLARLLAIYFERETKQS